MSSKSARQLSLLAFLPMATFLVSSHHVLAQAVFGQIVGTVTDSAGAVVPNATVTVTDVAKGTSVTLQSNGAGQFTADHLIPDVYDVKVAASGFKGFEQTGIQVFAATSPSVHAELAVAASAQT